MDILRKRAEEIKKLSLINISQLSGQELEKLIEELQIHQIELQIQNEELRSSRLELEVAKSKYFNLFDLAPVGYLVINEQGIIIELNLKASEIFERRKDYLINHPVVSLLDNTSMSKFYEYFELVQKSHKVENIEILLNKKGITQYLELSITKYLNDSFLVILSDITERKLADYKLKNNELQLKIITDNIPVFISYVGSDLKFLFVNKKYEDHFGVKSEFLVGRHIKELLSPESFANSEPYIQRALNGETVSFEVKSKSAAYMGIVFDVVLIPNFYDNNVIGYFSFIQDITNRKHAEDQVLRAKDLYKKILDDFPALIWQSGTDKLCYFFNRTWLKFTGRTYEQEFGNGWAEGVHPDDLENCLNVYNSAFDQRVHFEMEYRLKNHKGEYRRLIDFGSPFYDLNDEFAGFIGSCYDITIDRENSALLKELNATKDKLFSIIAHDLKSPFTSILGFSELLYKNLESYEIEKTRKYLSGINSSAKQTLNLLDNLLEWAKTQTGQIHYKPVTLNLNRVIHAIINISKPAAEFKQINLIFNPSMELNIIADLNMLNTVLRNLISNAIKYCNICGDVVIACELIDKNIQICITDNGVGMSSTLLNTLFVVSEKVSSPGTANERGTGLGLIICKEFVEKMGGKIWAESEIGIGSSFYINLPHHFN